MKNLSVTKEAGLKWKRQPTPGFLPGKSHARRSLVGYNQSVGSQRVRHNWATSFSLSDRWDKSKSPFWMTKPFLVISMENTLLFLFVAFGDFRNQLELFSSSWECSTLGQEQPGLFFPLLHLTLVKVLNITTDLAASGETIKDKQIILNKTSSLVLGFTHTNTLGDHKQHN